MGGLIIESLRLLVLNDEISATLRKGISSCIGCFFDGFPS